MPLAARSPLPSTTSCSYPTSNDGGAPYLTSNSTTYCDDISDGGVLVLTLCVVGPLVLIIIIFLSYLLLQWIRPRHSRGRNPKPDSDSDQSTLEKINFDGKGGDDDGSATCVSVNNPALGEVDISSLSYHDQLQSNQSVMPFLRKGLFRAASSSSCPADSQGTTPPIYSFQAAPLASQSSTAQHADNNDVGEANPGMDVCACNFSGRSTPAPTCQSAPTASRFRSFSESIVTLSSSSDFYSAHPSGPGSRAPSTSLPSSPSIPPPPTGTGSGTGTTGNAGRTPSTFSLSLSEKLERLNKQMMQKKTSNSSLRGTAEPGSPICGNDEGDTSMEFKCRGLPESGTFSVLTNAEAEMRVEDELATIERLALRV